VNLQLGFSAPPKEREGECRRFGRFSEACFVLEVLFEKHQIVNKVELPRPQSMITRI
jgi:hypothetical protein